MEIAVHRELGAAAAIGPSTSERETAVAVIDFSLIAFNELPLLVELRKTDYYRLAKVLVPC